MPAPENADAVEVPQTAADLLGYHERNAGRLVVDPAEAQRAFGKAVAARLKLSADGRYVLWPQPTSDPEDPQNWSDARKNLQLLIITLASIVPDFVGSIGITGLYTVTDMYPFHLQARKLNLWTMGFIVSPFLSPFFLGFMVAHVDYKWAYVVGALYSLGVLLMIVVRRGDLRPPSLPPLRQTPSVPAQKRSSASRRAPRAPAPRVDRVLSFFLTFLYFLLTLLAFCAPPAPRAYRHASDASHHTPRAQGHPRMRARRARTARRVLPSGADLCSRRRARRSCAALHYVGEDARPALSLPSHAAPAGAAAKTHPKCGRRPPHALGLHPALRSRSAPHPWRRAYRVRDLALPSHPALSRRRIRIRIRIRPRARLRRRHAFRVLRARTLKHRQTVCILAYVLPNSGRLVFRLRRAHDKNHTIVVFESDAVADWIVASWANLNGRRGEFEIVTARSMRPNA
ncbi:hypothetical protein B0H17DRAFT_1201735 [Mycena rosella]|uniref:MFS transporter n=1 Tax=Mycena rosella TaxID=1033263 RepID=A0AAD7DGF8_MYCRO|nr:hypothetical protein B0H17DRAFT_1201735 [Mycena rosella]